ncbi:MAG: HEAT repeat domain-containing protein, partial [Acidimicrobiales bacterium]
GIGDPNALVRRRSAELSVGTRGCDPSSLLADPDPTVVEAAAWALGEIGQKDAVPPLCDIARDHPDALCRESAIASLGALGDDRALPTVLAALADKPAIRRRAVIALAPFEGPETHAALERALQDRDWQVRQAAEDLLEDRRPG